MAKYTDNYNLILPEQNENYDVGVANTNNVIIDSELAKRVEKVMGKGLSTNDFTNEYKSKVDNLQKIYKFKGNVDTYSDLNNISANNGDIYNVLDEAKNYAWNGTEWVQLGFVIDMSEFAYREELPTKTSELENDSNFVDEETLNQTKNDMEEVSVPAGGTKGQILEKKSNEDNDVGWVDNTGGVTGDTLPIGTVVDFDGETVPENWEEVEDEDTGWIEATLTNSFVTYTNDGTNYTPQYRKLGKLVEIRGVVAPKEVLPYTTITGTYTIFELPKGFRPSRNIARVQQGSGLNKWVLNILENGNVSLTRYGINEEINVATTAWLPFDETFLID